MGPVTSAKCFSNGVGCCACGSFFFDCAALGATLPDVVDPPLNLPKNDMAGAAPAVGARECWTRVRSGKRVPVHVDRAATGPPRATVSGCTHRVRYIWTIAERHPPVTGGANVHGRGARQPEGDGLRWRGSGTSEE